MSKFCDSVLRNPNYIFCRDEENFKCDILDAKDFYIPNNDTCFCYDIFRMDSLLDLEHLFVVDLKILFELRGESYDCFYDICQKYFYAFKLKKYCDLSTKVDAYLNSFDITKININNFNPQKLVPKELLIEFYKERAFLMKELYSQLKSIDFFYIRFYEIIKYIHKLNKKPIFIDKDSLENEDSHYAKMIKSCEKDGKVYLKINPIGAKTGRLSFEKGTFNIYTIPKELRKCIVPSAGCDIVQFDFKSSQPRIAISLTEDANFKEKFREVDDIYQVFGGDRDKNKIGFISWMYSMNKNAFFEEKALPIMKLRDDLHKKALNENVIRNIFDRPLTLGQEEKNVVLQNYITSIESDFMLNLMLKVDKLCENTNSRLLFPFHDALIFEVCHKDKQLIALIVEQMESFGRHIFGCKFPVSVKSGKNYGQMENCVI